MENQNYKSIGFKNKLCYDKNVVLVIDRKGNAMSVFQKLYDCFIKPLTVRKAMAVILGNIIIGIGAAGLRLSLMGNDPYTAANMALSEGFQMGLGTYQLIINMILLMIQLIWGRNYLGVGSIVNMCFLGYIVQYATVILQSLIGDGTGKSFFYQLVYMLISLITLSFGLSMYQIANLGVAPYDYLALGMTDYFKPPYFVNRVITDAFCVLMILASAGIGFISWENSHLGIGTVLAAFCLGPFVNMFNHCNRGWIIKNRRQQV